MKAPSFWNTAPAAPGWQARVLAPLGALYAALTARRVAQSPSYTAPVPVICIGNLNAGGTGKTPTTIAIAQMLVAQGATPHIVSRGYGGSEPGPLRVTQNHSADHVGDEPLLLAAFAPTWIAKDRAAGVRAAVKAGASHILMDDGFQNPTVAKTLSLIVVDAARGFGNGLCIPAGPLREPVRVGLERAHMLVSLGTPSEQQRFAHIWGSHIPESVTHLDARLEPLQTGYDFEGQRVLAFAGIGHPDKFFNTLRQTRAEIVDQVPLGDHQPLTPALMARLERDAALQGAQLVTTEKDAVRLPHAFRQQVITVPVRLIFSAPLKMDDALTALA